MAIKDNFLMRLESQQCALYESDLDQLSEATQEQLNLVINPCYYSESEQEHLELEFTGSYIVGVGFADDHPDFLNFTKPYEWHIDNCKFAATIATMLGYVSVEIMPDRLWKVGSIDIHGINVDVMYARGLTWADKDTVLIGAYANKAGEIATVLVPTNKDIKQDDTCLIFVSLEPILGIDETGFHIDRKAISAATRREFSGKAKAILEEKALAAQINAIGNSVGGGSGNCATDSAKVSDDYDQFDDDYFPFDDDNPHDDADYPFPEDDELVTAGTGAGVSIKRENTDSVLEATTVNTAGTSSATPRYLFKKGVDHWTIVYDGVPVDPPLKSTKGLEYIAFLLAHPGEQTYALQIIQHVNGSFAEPNLIYAAMSEGQRNEENLYIQSLGDDGIPVDQSDTPICKERMNAALVKLAQAELTKVNIAIKEARFELKSAQKELNKRIDKNDRPRKTGSSLEKARYTVTKGIDVVMKKLKKQAHPLYDHLLHIKTGTKCIYDPIEQLPWVF